MEKKYAMALRDCLAIIEEMRSAAPHDSDAVQRACRLNLLWTDLSHKSSSFDEEVRAQLFGIAGLSALGAHYTETDLQSGVRVLVNGGRKLQADVMILTVIEEEYNSTLIAFGLDPKKDISRERGILGHRFMEVFLRTRHCGTLRIWICLIGEARNVVCANFCRDLFEVFSTKQCFILVGIAAGRKGTMNYGDVAGGQLVYDVAGGRAEPRRVVVRDEPFRLAPEIRGYFNGYNPERTDWLSKHGTYLSKIRESGSPLPPDAERLRPKYKPGIIVTGEKLRRDNPLPKIARRLGDRLLAAEMEGAGFAATCETKKIPWLIFRGISDYGDMEKRDEWQAIAALHAALAAKSFLEKALHPLHSPNAEGPQH